jgi:hypothetical protein
MLTRYQAQAQNLVSDELVSHLGELYSSLTSHTERVQSTTEHSAPSEEGEGEGVEGGG